MQSKNHPKGSECITKPQTRGMATGKQVNRMGGKKANEDMNHRTKSVVRDVVQGHKSRASYFFSQALNGVELLLQGQTSVSQDLKAAEIKQTRR